MGGYQLDVYLSIAISFKISAQICQFRLAGLTSGCLKLACIYSLPLIPMSYVVASKLKELVKKHGMMSSGDLSDAVSASLEASVAKACDRAKANGRKTVRSEDL